MILEERKRSPLYSNDNCIMLFKSFEYNSDRKNIRAAKRSPFYPPLSIHLVLGECIRWSITKCACCPLSCLETKALRQWQRYCQSGAIERAPMAVRLHSSREESRVIDCRKKGVIPLC